MYKQVDFYLSMDKMSSMDIFVARQPIFTLEKEVFGYEMLFRDGFKNAFPDINGNAATSSVLSNIFFSFNLTELLDGKPGLINFTKDLILNKTPLLFPKKHLVIEVLEDIEPDNDILAALQDFRKAGFNIALDDFVYHKKLRPMMELCQIIKFDLMATPLDTLEPVIEDIRKNYRITLLAEKVETYAQFELAKNLGFELFQGYFFSKPQIISNKDISPNHAAKLKLINELAQKDINFGKIESFIRQDVSTAFRLLKFMNCVYFKRTLPLSTIKDAISYLGENELKKFLTLIIFSDIGEQKPDELIRYSLVRARMCELCGSVLKSDYETDELFILGLFSYMDAILDKNMIDIVKYLCLSEKIKNALLGTDKNFNKILNIVKSVEQGNWNGIYLSILAGTPIEKKIPQFYFDAISLANSFFK